ncbi:MAG: tetratricopeptide repeat protein [Deltaproteobacteria bacterium]|nr:tetratricopeptide repeat protein [Deltaproteobacteria bacterium]
MWGYRTSDVARMLGVPEERVRSWARLGFASPRRGPRGALLFSFQDLVLLRSARELLAAGVPARRAGRALRSLRRRLPEGRTLASVRIAADGDRLVIRDGKGAWRPESGQGLFDFGVAQLAERVAPIVKEAAQARDASGLDAQAWYLWGCDLEGASPAQARKAYARALELDPDHPGANLNLGRLLHEAGDGAGAELHYRRALEARPGDGVALFNLGVALEDQGKAEEALLAYARCLESAPEQADAHFNASRILERLGRKAEALRHLVAYRRLTRGGGR